MKASTTVGNDFEKDRCTIVTSTWTEATSLLRFVISVGENNNLNCYQNNQTTVGTC